MNDGLRRSSSPGQQPLRQPSRDGGAAPRPRRPADQRLNYRQQQHLHVLFELDQQAERDQRRRWHQGLPRQSADQWRWIPYINHHAHASLTPAQQALNSHNINVTSSGATLAALIRRGLLEIRHIIVDSPTGGIRQTQLRLTPNGRQTARATQPTADAGPAPLPAWLHEALSCVANAPSPGLAKIEISRIAARRLGPKEYGYIQDSTAWSYSLTEAGQTYLVTAQRLGYP